MTNEEFVNNVAENIRLCVESNGRSIGQICNDLGISRTTLSNYINGRFVPSLYIAYHIIKYFDITLEELIGLSKEDECTARLQLGLSKRTYRDLAKLPYKKKKIVVDMIDVLSQKE